MRGILRLTATTLFLLLTGATSWAQNASITGTIRDASGASVPDVAVTARNTETNASKTATTNESGSYRIVELPPGPYEVVVSKSGFREVRYANVTLTVSQVLTLDAQLEISVQATTVEVNAQTLAPIELDNASLSNVVDSRHITDLPLITRDPYQLVLLSPGVIQSNTADGGFSVNGQRDRNNNFLLDGVDNNDTDVPGIPSGITALNPEATQEFRVITNNFLPEYGRNSGGIIEVITKSGTNELHGSAYWFGRYNATAARDFFNHNIDGLTGNVEAQNPFVRNIFGGTAGGKLIKDKTFWFGNYDGSRFVTTLTNETAVPTPAFQSGQFTFNGTPVDFSPSSPQNNTGLPIDPTIASILALYPAANAGATAVDDVRGLYRFGSSSRSNSDNFTIKVDHNLTQKHVLSVRYTFNRFTDPNPFHSDFLPGLDAVSTYQRTQNASIALTSTLSSRLVNDFRFGGNRTHLDFNCSGTSVFDSFGPVDPFGRGIDYSLSGLNNFGCGTLGDSNGQSRFTGTYTIADSVSMIHGNHNMKFGVEHRRAYSNSFNAFFSRTNLSFNIATDFGVPSINLDPNNPCDLSLQGSNPTAFAARCGSITLQNMGWMLTGVVDQDFQGQFFDKNGDRTANDLRGFRQRDLRLYAQDAWKIKPNLTLSYGLAWQFYGVPFEVNNNFSNLFQDPSGFAPFTFTIVGPGSGAQVYDDYYKNFEPRIGFAWDPEKKGRMSIRGGYGIFHDRVFGNLIGNARGNPPFEQDFFAFVGDLLPNVGIPPTQTPSAAVADGTFITPIIFDKKYRTPEVQSWNFGVQREWIGNLTFEVDYVGSHTTHLFREVDGNPPQPDLVAGWIAAGIDPAALTFTSLWTGGTDSNGNDFGPSVNNNAFFQAFLQKSIANATYHGLQIKVSQRMWHGLQVGGAYTFAHAIDDASDPLTPAAGNRGFPRNSFNLRAERGNSDFDIRHRVVINYLYELPFGRGKSRWGEGFVGHALEGWQLSGITTIQTGLPFDVFGVTDSQHTGLSDRAELIGNPSQPAGHDKTLTGPNVNAFENPLLGGGVPSNVGRNHFYGPGFVDFDVVAQKSTTLSERVKLIFRTEAYNLFNHANFTQPGNSLGAPGTFGLSTGEVGRPDGTSGARQLQFALKLAF
jgi:hypothetical protein